MMPTRGPAAPSPSPAVATPNGATCAGTSRHNNNNDNNNNNNNNNSLNQVNNGKQITCNVPIGASLIPYKVLQIGNAVCTTGNSCAQPLSIIGSLTGTDVSGSLIMTQSGKQYGSVGISANVFAGGSTYRVSGCVPQAATQIKLSAINSNGGVDNEQNINVQ